MKMSLAQAAAAMDGHLFGADSDFSVVNTDTRAIHLGDLFVALHGENFNGEAFVERAMLAGACAAVLTHKQDDLDFPQIVVDNTTVALGKLAHAWRQLLTAKVVAITGSCGKTSTKGMLRSICELSGATKATHGNLNNHIGVPLTLLAADESLDYLIVEAGTSGKGEIGYLGQLIYPDVSVVINVYPAHLQGFGSLTAIAEEKAKIYQHMAAEPIRLINTSLLSYDDIAVWANDEHSYLFSVDAQSSAYVRAENIKVGAVGCLEFDLCVGGQRQAVRLSVPGRHHLENAIAAAACAHALGVGTELIARGLLNYAGEQGRMQISRVGELTLVDDTYNANPASMQAAIDYLSEQGDSILVLGDMAELGEHAEQMHQDIGRYAAEKGINELFVVGAFADDYCDGFGSAALRFHNQQELLDELQQRLSTVTTVLVKGSHSSEMNRVCYGLQQVGGAQ